MARLGVAAFATCALTGAAARVRADTVLTFNYTPATRAQVALWIEDGSGQFLATVALTEAVATAASAIGPAHRR